MEQIRLSWMGNKRRCKIKKHSPSTARHFYKCSKKFYPHYWGNRYNFLGITKSHSI